MPDTESVDGLIDDVQIWNRSLNQSEIQELMQSPPNGSEQNLVGYWNFENDSGTTINDISSYNNQGAFIGASSIQLSNDTPNYSTTENLNSFASTPTGTYIEVPNSETLNPVSLTIAMWVKLNSLGNTGYNHYVNKWEGENYQFVFANNTNSNGGLYLYYSTTDGPGGANLSGAFPQLNQWEFIAVTYGSVGTTYSWVATENENSNNLFNEEARHWFWSAIL